MPDEFKETEEMKRLARLGKLFQKGWAKTHPIPPEHLAMIDGHFNKPLEERMKEREKEEKEELARQKKEKAKQQSQTKDKGPSHSH